MVKELKNCREKQMALFTELFWKELKHTYQNVCGDFIHNNGDKFKNFVKKNIEREMIANILITTFWEMIAIISFHLPAPPTQ